MSLHIGYFWSVWVCRDFLKINYKLVSQIKAGWNYQIFKHRHLFLAQYATQAAST